MNIVELMTLAAEKNASDLHITPNEPPILRLDGDLQRLDEKVLSREDVANIANELMSEKQRNQFEKTMELDFSSEIKGVARFRINAYRHKDGIGIALRMIPYQIPCFDDLAMSDPIFQKMCEYENGLVIVTGPTGVGKSTTMAAMINHINSSAKGKKHILTIEDPVEYIYKNKNCMIHQREVGLDTLGFHASLRSALREDPDIILVGEMRDLETIRLALTAAETGHLVITTMHTVSAAQTVDRIVDVFPRSESPVIRAMLAESLRAIVAQRLLPKIGGGRVAAQEIMIANGAIRNLIREQKVPQIYSAIQTGKADGMRTLDSHIEELVKAGIVEKQQTVSRY